MKRTIIITAGTGAEAQSNAKNYPDARIIFADSRPVPEVLVKMGKYVQLPDPESPAFIHELLKCCLDHGADTIVLLSEREQALLQPQKLLFEEYSIQLI